jgi:putative salt-induced outer membrane protein
MPVIFLIDKDGKRGAATIALVEGLQPDKIWMTQKVMLRLSTAVVTFCLASTAHAALPDPVKAMMEAAALQGRASDLDMVASLARLTNPDDVPEINELLALHLAALQTPPPEELPEPEPEPEVEPEIDPARSLLETAFKGQKDAEVEAIGKLAKTAYPDNSATYDMLLIQYRARRADQKAKEAAEARRKLAEARIWENWKGEGQIGASMASGNTNSRGLSSGLSISRKGLNWNAKLRAQADYQRVDGVTSVERYIVEGEPQYQLSDRAFAYGLGRWERDRILGYDRRLNLSGGLGYKVIDDKNLSLSLKGGPAWRQTDFITGLGEDEITGLAGLDIAWKLSPTLKLTQVASTVVGEVNSQTSSLTALSAKLGGAFSARLAYSAEIASNPPPGVKNVDTLTRFTLVYGF